MDLLRLVGLEPLMSATPVNRAISVAVVGGPVDRSHPDLNGARIRVIEKGSAAESKPDDPGCRDHETFVVGMLAARRGTLAPAICPGCDLLVRPVFQRGVGSAPSTTSGELAEAILDVVKAGARIVNLSVSLESTSVRRRCVLEEACDAACRRGVLVVAASGNQGRVGASTLVRHPWLIPVAACDASGRLHPRSNVGPSIATLGAMAPGVGILSTVSRGRYARRSGISYAAPFVTGAAALLWSLVPSASAAELRYVIAATARRTDRTILPGLLDAQQAWSLLRRTARR